MKHSDPGTTHGKVFNIGFHKTGTTSLTWFMHQHSYRTLHNTAYSMERLHLGSQHETGVDDGESVDVASLIDPVLLDQLVQEYDFFSDNPWPLLFRRLDQSYPESRFILTHRHVDSWAESLARYAGSQRTRMRKLIYGYGNPQYHLERYREVYIMHNNDVIEYFRDRDNLLVIDIEDDDRIIAKRLCIFLGLEQGKVLFPNTNSTRV
jgi:hypothetical protein